MRKRKVSARPDPKLHLLRWTEEEFTAWARWMMDLHGLQNVGLEVGDYGGDSQAYFDCIYIDLPDTLSNPMKVVMHTLLHEIAHVLVRPQRHTRRWALKAVEIGCDPRESRILQQILFGIDWGMGDLGGWL